jgi:hypothetical protein
MVTEFLSSQNSKSSILNLTGFRNIGLKASKNRSTNNNRYIKLWGSPDLAVSYALTQKAAAELLISNTPIMGVSDWPVTECNYFVPIRPPVKHGDVSTSSLIDSTKSSFRNDESLYRKLWKLTLVKYFVKRPMGVSLFHFIRVTYGRKIQWRYDYLKVKFELEFLN